MGNNKIEKIDNKTNKVIFIVCLIVIGISIGALIIVNVKSNSFKIEHENTEIIAIDNEHILHHFFTIDGKEYTCVNSIDNEENEKLLKKYNGDENKAYNSKEYYDLLSVERCLKEQKNSQNIIIFIVIGFSTILAISSARTLSKKTMDNKN